MNDRQLKSFIDVVKSGSFSKAEGTMYISRQALKKHIDALERELDFKLFVRSSKGITLTPEGKIFYEGVKNILDDMVMLIKKSRDTALHQQTIKIANPSHPRLMLERAFEEFANRYPAIRQEIVFPAEAKLIGQVLDGSVDAAECVLPKDVDKSMIGYTKLGNLKYMCLVSDTHPLAGKKALSPEELSGYSIALRKSGNQELIQLLRQECQNITLYETTGDEMQHIYSICYNHGIFISRAYYATTLQQWIAIPLLTDLEAECYLIYQKNYSLPVRKFIEVVVDLYPQS